MVEKKFIIEIQGNEFITFEGLLDEFHKNKGESIHTEIVSKDPLIIRATAKGEKGTYTGMGDANEQNTGGMVKAHLIRMAETRAIARALRWYNNIGMCSSDEVADFRASAKPVPAQKNTDQKIKPVEIKPQPELKCEDCNSKVTPKVAEYSAQHKGKILCYQCQQKPGK